jgi:hypothetical protein
MRAPCKKHHITASTLSHHDDFRRTVRNLVTTQKPSQTRNFRRREIQFHNQATIIPRAIALIRRIV